MSSIKAERLRFAILGIIFMPLIFSFGAGKIVQLHVLLTPLPFQLQTARFFCVVVTLLSLLSIPFINRYSMKDAERLRERGVNPALLLLLLDLTMLLLPTIFVLLLFFIGLPAKDVYFYSYPSFLLMIGWLLWKRHAFWFDDGNKSTLRSSSPYLALMSYTVVLCGLTALSSLFLILKLILMIKPPQEYAVPFFVNLPWAIIYASIVIGCSFTVMLRFRNSQYAFDVTALTSTLVAFWIPFGTAVYLYWRFKIKSKEFSQKS